MSTTETPYLETFGCRLNDGEDHDHPGDCDWGYACGTCGRPVDDGPCPDHAPLDVPGLMLADCAAEPRHPRTWLLANDAGYGAPCMYCAYDTVNTAHAGCEHSRHGRWRRSRVIYRLLGYGYSLGFVASRGITWDGGGCGGCMTGIRFGRSGYLLGQENEWWTCLLRHHHFRKPDPDCPAFCNVCTPPREEWAA